MGSSGAGAPSSARGCPAQKALGSAHAQSSYRQAPVADSDPACTPASHLKINSVLTVPKNKQMKIIIIIKIPSQLKKCTSKSLERKKVGSLLPFRKLLNGEKNVKFTKQCLFGSFVKKFIQNQQQLIPFAIKTYQVHMYGGLSGRVRSENN